MAFSKVPRTFQQLLRTSRGLAGADLLDDRFDHNRRAVRTGSVAAINKARSGPGAERRGVAIGASPFVAAQRPGCDANLGVAALADRIRLDAQGLAAPAHDESRFHSRKRLDDARRRELQRLPDRRRRAAPKAVAKARRVAAGRELVFGPESHAAQLDLKLKGILDRGRAEGAGPKPPDRHDRRCRVEVF